MATRHKTQDVGKWNYIVIPFVKWEISFTCEVRKEKSVKNQLCSEKYNTEYK